MIDYYKINKNSIICEIGSHSGVSSELFADNCGTLFCCDFWEYYNEPAGYYVKEAEERFDKLLYKYDNIIKMKGDSKRISKTFTNHFFDLVYIDAAHDYNSVYNDILHWKDKVKPGGILSGHDYWYQPIQEALSKFFDLSRIVYFEDSSWSIQL